MLVQPYLSFDGRCEEAIEFYRKALGAEMQMLMRFKEAPDPYKCQPGSEDKVMHMCFRIGDTAFLHPTAAVKANPISRAFRCLSRQLMVPKPNGCSTRWQTVGRCKCPWPRPFFRRVSAWLPTALACLGWSS